MIAIGSKRGQVYCYLKLFGKLMNQSMNRAISRGARAPKKLEAGLGMRQQQVGFFCSFSFKGNLTQILFIFSF